MRQKAYSDIFGVDVGSIQAVADGGGGGGSDINIVELIANEQALQDFVASRISTWLIGGLGLTGPWAGLVSVIVAQYVSSCFSPSLTADRFMVAVDARDSQIATHLPPIKSVKLPSGIKTTPATVSVQSVGRTADMQMASLVIPFDQTVEIQYEIWAHGALCQADRARVEIVGNENGQLVKPFRREVIGKAGISPRTNQDSGVVSLQLTAGGYIVRAAQAPGKYNGAKITVKYQRAEIPPGTARFKIPPAVIAGVGVGCAVAGIYVIARGEGG